MTETILNSTYRIIKKIGQGGGGIVYKAYHERLQKYVVLKQIKSEVSAFLDARNEVDLLKKLKHTYLPQVLDFIEHDGMVFTVMDFIDGKELGKYQNKKPLKVNEIISISKQLCEAVQYLHSQNPPVIHSDIKPANIMITEKGDICLIDFNISLVFNDVSGAIGGTKGYAAPEQFGLITDSPFTSSATARKKRIPDSYVDNDDTEYEADMTLSVNDSEAETVFTPEKPTPISARNNKGNAIDKRADIYAIGAVIYSMITETAPSGDYKNIKPVRSFNEKVPEGLIMVVEKAMAYNPKNRYSSVTQILNILNNVMKMDKRYRALKIRRVIVSIICFLGMTVSAIGINYSLDVIEDERNAKYMAYIDTADNAINNGAFEEAEEAITLATDFMPERPEAYYETVFSKYSKDDYIGTVEYYENHRNIFDGNAFDLKSNLYFVLGNAYLELEDYSSAILQYRKSLELNPERTDCYRDLAISYARFNEIDNAIDILEQAINVNVSNDQILLMKGEIEIMKGNYMEALELLENAATETTDSYILFRSLLVYVKFCDKELVRDSHKYAADILENNLEKISAEYEPYIHEMLANQYSLLGQETGNVDYYYRAISYYDKLILNANQNYSVYKNCFEIEFLIEEYSLCEWTLDRMEEIFPDDYWTAMNRSNLEIKIQSKRNQEERNYEKAYSYYETAEGRYKKYSKNGKTDPNMETLGELINQLIQGGWLNG